MKFNILGLGGWISHPALDTVSIVVEIENFKILIDCGEAILKRLHIAGLNIEDIDILVVTHSHGDHSLGFPSIVLWSAYRQKKIKLITLEDTYRDLLKLLEATHIEHHKDTIESICIKSAKEPVEIFSNEKVRIKVVEVDHTIPCIAVRVEDTHGRSIVYSGDTRPCESIVKLAKNCDVLIYETSTRNLKCREHGHSTVDDSLEIALKCGCKILIPIHYYTTFDIMYKIRGDNGVNVLIPTQYVWYDVDKLLESI